MCSCHRSVERHLLETSLQNITLHFDFHIELHFGRYLGLPEDLRHF